MQSIGRLGLTKTFQQGIQCRQNPFTNTRFKCCKNTPKRNFSNKQSPSIWEKISTRVNNLFSKRFRQSERIYNFLYQRLFFSKPKQKWISYFFNYKPQKKPFYLIGGAACSFSWEESAITDNDIEEHINELRMVKSAQPMHDVTASQLIDNTESHLPDNWENVLNEPNIKIWKLPYKDTEFMQYKVFGRFHDVSARQFFAVQADHEYRRKWDDLALDIDIVDENKKTGEQILRWITYFPFPFNSREYVYIRRAKIFKKDNILAIMARSVDHPKCKTKKGNVRVPLYISDMIIVPHKSIDEPGLDYLLTYCDDPQTSLPSTLSTWIIYKGIPNYVEQLHQASLNINKNRSVEVTRMIEKYEYEIKNFESSQTIGRL